MHTDIVAVSGGLAGLAGSAGDLTSRPTGARLRRYGWRARQLLGRRVG